MSNNQHNQDFDILRVIELARDHKYEVTVAGFEVLDKIDKIDIPKGLKPKKVAVQALYALSEKMVQYDYFTSEQRKQLAEVKKKQEQKNPEFNNLFAKSSAPEIEESDSDEEEILEEEPPKVLSSKEEDDDDDFSDYDDNSDDDDFDDSNDSFEDEESEYSEKK
ncbi:MAG: DNA primase [Leptospiraceae bacterium]|nr:DNA primase [Leptospiraceae bacterium]MCP5499042.1 DNA primase [Leptospiraceae bacterium]